MMNKTILTPLLILLFTACNNTTQPAAEGADEGEVDINDICLTQKQIQTADISTGHLVQKNLGQTIRANGQLNLDAQSRAEISSLVGGIVRSICTHEGNHVSRGQVVAYIENTDIVEMQRSYMTAVNEMHSAKQDLDRQKMLKQQGAGVQKNLQQAQTAYAAAQTQVSGIAQQLQQLGIAPKSVVTGKFTTRIPIKSPISGIVGNIKVSLGSYVDMQSVLMTVVDNSQLHCDLRIFEKDIPYVKTGQTVTLVLTNDKNIRLTGKVYGINQAFDDDTKAVKVHVGITSHPAVTLMPAMYVTADINVGSHMVAAIPDEAVITKDGKKYLFMLTKTTKGTSNDGSKAVDNVSHFRMTEVQTGISNGGYTEVSFGTQVPTGATFVTGNAFYIASMVEGGAEEG